MMCLWTMFLRIETAAGLLFFSNESVNWWYNGHVEEKRKWRSF